MALTATLNKATFVPGETMTLTVVSDKRLQSSILDVLAAGDDAKATVTVLAGIVLTDPAGRKWAVASDDGKTAVFTATA
jgi:hypothetical protein